MKWSTLQRVKKKKFSLYNVLKALVKINPNGLLILTLNVKIGESISKTPLKIFILSLYTDLESEKVTWHVAMYGDPYSELVLCIYPILSAHTQQWTHTHREHTPGAVGSHLCCGARGAVGGSVPCSSAPQSWYWRRRERCTFTPPTYNPCRPETQTRKLWITSPTL